MSKQKPAKPKSKFISVYNDTDGMISCALPDYGPENERRPSRLMTLLPGNNPEVPRDDWEKAMENEVFKGYTTLRPVKNQVGKLIKKRQLVVGKFDEDQPIAEQEFDQRMQREREAQRIEGLG